MAADGNPGAFGKRGTIALVVFAVLAFVAFLYLAAQGGLSGGTNDGRAHAGGTGLVGFAGLTRMLEADGTQVVRSREPGMLDAPGLLVLTPPATVDPAELADLVERRRTIGPTMIVAPKWQAMPSPSEEAKPGWVHPVGTIGAWSFEIDGRAIALEADAWQRQPRWRGLDRRGTLPHEALVMRVDEEETHEGLLAPLVEDAQGRMLAGYLADDGSFLTGDLFLDPARGDGRLVYGVMLVAEPDLVNNWGLAEEARALLALELVEIARQGTEDPVTFDMTLNGLGASRNLLTLAFEPPFLAATLTLLLALAIALWRAFNRFGPALRPVPAIQPGKSQLVANGAQVIARSGRLRLLRDPYSALVGARVSERLGLRPHPDEPVETALRARERGDLADAIAALRQARGRTEILRAARALSDAERTTLK